MRWKIGVAILIASTVAALVLAATGHLGSVQSVTTTSGGPPDLTLEVTEYSFHPNWRVALPLAGCFALGLLCLIVNPAAIARRLTLRWK